MTVGTNRNFNWLIFHFTCGFGHIDQISPEKGNEPKLSSIEIFQYLSHFIPDGLNEFFHVGGFRYGHRNYIAT